MPETLAISLIHSFGRLPHTFFASVQDKEQPRSNVTSQVFPVHRDGFRLIISLESRISIQRICRVEGRIRFHCPRFSYGKRLLLKSDEGSHADLLVKRVVPRDQSSSSPEQHT